MWQNGRKVYAHRAFYELVFGPIPVGFFIDHLCKQTLCVNPNHMQVVTHRENTLRGNSLCAQRARQTRCTRGHLLEGDNIYPPPPSSPHRRRCKHCHNEHQRRYRLNASATVA